MKIIVNNQEIETEKLVIIDNNGTKHIISDSPGNGIMVKLDDFIPLS